MSTLTQECIDTCNSLLRGELSAVETYRQAQEKFVGQPEAQTLTDIRYVHEEHVMKLRSHVLEMGGEPSHDSGAWGAFAQAVTGAAKLFGETTALEALIQGEKNGLNEYQNAANSEHVMAKMKETYVTEIIPALQRNIQTLEQMQANL